MKSVKVLAKVDVGVPEGRALDLPNPKPPRRSVDDFTSKLILRSLQRKDTQDIEQRFGQHTLVKKFRTKPVSRLALTIIGTAQPHTLCLTERKPEKKVNKVILLRNTLSNFRLSMEMGVECVQQEDPILKAYSCKIKKLHCQLRNKNVFVVLPTDFLMDQSHFWKEQEPEDSGVKVWRQLVNVANIVWLAKKEKTLQKFLDYCQRMILPLDAMYLLEPKKNKVSLTVNLNPMKVDLQLDNSNKVIFFGLVRECEEIDSFQILENKLPLLQHKYLYVHLLNAKTSGVAAFNRTVQILKKQPIQKLNLKPIFEQYTEYLTNFQETKSRRNFSSMHKRFRFSKEFNNFKEQTEEVSILDRIQILKKDWTDWILKMKNLSMTPNTIDGDSVPFIVGDMLKRNYPLLDKLYRKQQQSSKRKNRNISSEHQQPHSAQTKIKRIKQKIEYTTPVFIWHF